MWSPQRYLAEGIKLGIDIKILQSAVRQIQRLRSHNPPLPPLLSLSHLATTIESDTAYLDRVITRSETAYRGFSIRKRSGGLRDIYVPSSALMTTQRWIAQNILCELPVHSASQAFKKGNSIVNCAQVHCEAKWLIKLDIANFFGSISEPQIYKVFQRLGYNNLVSFQLTRLCTWPDFIVDTVGMREISRSRRCVFSFVLDLAPDVFWILFCATTVALCIDGKYGKLLRSHSEPRQ
jgi:RNA-directed DNA polymerase